ncbi:hypothetical protein [Planctomycetes bacterium Poly30]|uniref:hypothetical protein n=1 Tax=Saltatorellus ferox TaxID=2528018 RepID=UPI0011A4D1E5
MTHSLVDADLQTHYWLLAGQYTADELGEPHPSGGNFRLLIGASLHGGFDGSETSIEERDLTVNRTVLSGDVLGDDLPNYSNRADNLGRLFYSNTYSELRDVTLTQLDGIDFVHFGGPSGVGNGGTAILLEAQHRALIQDCRFSENWAGSSLVVASSLEVARTAWTSNRGLLMNQNGYGLASLCIENSSFLANVAKYRLVVGEGWAPMELVNLTVVANRVYQPTWSLFVQDEVMDGASMSVQNCIFWRNASGGSTSEAVHSSANALAATPPDIGWSCIDQWTGTTASTGVIAVDPRFVDAVGPDGIPFSGDEDLGLTPGSPCIDAGNNEPILSAGIELDLARSARRLDDPTVLDTGNGTAPIVDMGALERR